MTEILALDNLWIFILITAAILAILAIAAYLDAKDTEQLLKLVSKSHYSNIDRGDSVEIIEHNGEETIVTTYKETK